MVTINSSTDAEHFFGQLCEKPLPRPASKSENSYGYLPLSRLTNPATVDDSYPDVEETKGVKRLLTLIPALNKNLDYTESEEAWRAFYCFPPKEAVQETVKKEKVASAHIVNASDSASEAFRDRVIKIAKEASLNSTNNFVFLSGSTGVGKTTFVKYHTKTQKIHYIRNDIVISRLKFRDLERIIHSRVELNESGVVLEKKSSPIDIFESYIIDCLFRDLLESHRVVGGAAAVGADKNQKGRLEAAILEAESMVNLLGELTKSDAYLLKSIFMLNEGEQQQISLDIKLAALSQAVKVGFRFALFLDGFDAIEPETIKLDVQEESDIFLKCLEAVARGAFSGAGVAYQFLKTAPLVFIVSARPITVAQVKLSLQSEVDIRQETHHSEFLAPGRTFDIIRKRVSLRAAQRGHTLGSEDAELLIAVVERCLAELSQDYKNFGPDELLRIFNFNIRDKIGFLLLLVGFVIGKLASHIYEDEDVRKALRSDEISLVSYVKKLQLDRIGIARYEIEKILFLNRNEKFSNFFIYDLAQDKLHLSGEKGSFDNIYNYRSIHSTSGAGEDGLCPLIVKREILRYLIDEQFGQHNELVDWLDEFYAGIWSKTDIKLLIRGGMIEGSFEDGHMMYSPTEKGRFVFDELQYRYSYFERAAMAAALPKYVRRLMHPPRETSGGQWGLASIVNVGVFIRYLRMIELQQKLPAKNRLAARLQEKFSPTVRALAQAGMESTYRRYAPDLEAAFRIALK